MSECTSPEPRQWGWWVQPGSDPPVSPLPGAATLLSRRGDERNLRLRGAAAL